jgi:hypothetical protein
MPIYTYTTLDDPLATDTFGIGINNTGLIVGVIVTATASCTASF